MLIVFNLCSQNDTPTNMYCFSKLCRVCLRDDRPFINIYCANEDNVRICDILASVKPDMITMNNSLPPWICITCKKQLRRAYKFQKKCNKSLKTFIHYLSLLKHGNDENEPQQMVLNVQIRDTLCENQDEKKKKCEDDRNDAHEPIKSENFSYDSSADNSNGTNVDEIYSNQSDNRWNSVAFGDFSSDFICDVKEKFKFEQDSDADSESTVILNLNSIVKRIDVLNNKEDDLIGISELDSNSQSEQSNYDNTFYSSENQLKVDNFINSANELDKHLNSVIDIIQEISTDLSTNSVLQTSANNELNGKIENTEPVFSFNSNKSNNNNILSNNQSDVASETFWSEFTKKVASEKSNTQLDCPTNVHFNTNTTILHNDKSNSEILLNPSNSLNENNESNKAEPTTNTEVTVKDESAFENTTIELDEEGKYIFELDLTSNEESNNQISLGTDQIKNENETSLQIKIENEDTTELLPENTFCNINSTSTSTELNEEQKFVFELDFTRERDLNMDLSSALKTENVEDTISVEKTKLLSVEKEEKIILNNEEKQILNSENTVTSKLICSTYENVQDMLTIEKTEWPSLETEVPADLTTAGTGNISNINHFPHISVKTADKINSTIISQSNIAKSLLINQLPNGNVDLNNSRVINKNVSNFSIANLLNSTTNLQKQNKRLMNHTSNTGEAKTNDKECFGNDSVIIIDDDSSDRDMPLKRRKTGLEENRNSIYNYGENVLSNTEIVNKPVYSGSIHSGINSAEYVDMDEHMGNNFNTIRNFIKPSLTALSTHALNDNYNSNSSSHNIHNTNDLAVNANQAHSLKVNHNPYTHTSNIQSTVSNINQNNSNLYQNMYLPNISYQKQTSNSAPSCNTNSNYIYNYQTIKHNPNFPIDTNSTARNDYLSQRSNNHQYPAHYRNLPPKNLLLHTLTSLNPESSAINLHRNISSQSCIRARPMCNENKDSNTGRIANSLQNSTAIIPQLQKEFTLDAKHANSTQSALNEHKEQCSDQKDFMDENIDNRPASRTSQISSSTSSISSNSNAESAEGTTDSTVNNHFYTFFTNMETASAYLHTSVEGVVENEADELMFLVDKNKSVYICKKCCHHFPCISELYIHSEEHIDEFDYQTMIYRTKDHTAQSDCINFVIIEDIKLFVCGKCDMEFTDKLLLLAHVRRHVPNVNVSEVNLLVCKCQNCIAFSSQSGGTDFKCGKCDKTFPNAENLRVHGFIHFLEKPAKCVICNRNFQDKSRLHDHNLRMHTPKLECDVCKKLIRPDIFGNHQLMHQNPNHECDICGKKFPTRPRLLIHQRTHGDDKPFGCKYCDKKFLIKLVLDNHERVHTGEKPYECEVCKRRFSQRTSVQVHMRIHTGEKPYKCKDCGKCYTQSYVYKQHRKKHHPPSTP